jgi:hypothetical protein
VEVAAWCRSPRFTSPSNTNLVGEKTRTCSSEAQHTVFGSRSASSYDRDTLSSDLCLFTLRSTGPRPPRTVSVHSGE